MNLTAGYYSLYHPFWQYNKLRKYRTQVMGLEAELREHKLQASAAKNKYADWNAELQQKMKELREEKRQWLLQTGSLRTSQKETKVREFTSCLAWLESNEAS